MFYLILIGAIIYFVSSKANKKDTKFIDLLLQIREDENSDNNTIDAIITAHTLSKNHNIPFHIIVQKIKEILADKNSTNNSNSTNYNYDETATVQELDGQTSLFADEHNTQSMGYTPPTATGYMPPAPLNSSFNWENIQPVTPTNSDVPNYIPTHQQPQPKPPKKPIELDPSSIVLILGVVLVLTSAIIFSTTIWDNVNSFAKMGILIGLGLINFLISFAFHKRFETKLPSTAFYVLGYTFVSFSIITFGFFNVSTDLTKMFIEVGWLLTMSLFTTSICAFSFYGYKIYRKIAFLWVSLFCTDIIIFTLSKALFNNVNIVLLILAVYAVSIVYLLNFGKIKSEKSIIFNFSQINLIVISFVAVITTQANIFSILVCGTLAGGYLLSNKKQFNSDVSPILFCVLMMTGLFKAGFGNSVDTAFMMLTLLPLMVFIFKSMNLLDDELQTKLNLVTSIACFLVFFHNIVYVLMIEPSIYSIITLIILFISITILNTTSCYKYIHSVLVTAIVGEIASYINYHDMVDGRLVSFNISLLLFGIYMFYNLYTRYDLKSHVSQNIFPLFLFFTCFNTEYINPTSSVDYIFMIYYTLVVIACYIMNAVNENDEKVQYVYTSIATLFSVFLMSPIFKLIPSDTIRYNHILAIVIFAIAILLYCLKGFSITLKFTAPVNMVYLALTQAEYLTLFDFYDTSSYNHEIVFLFLAVATLYVVQKLIQEESFTLNYIFPFILVCNCFIVITNNVGGNSDLYFYVLTGLIAIASVLIKPNTSFQLPFNTITFALILFLKIGGEFDEYFNYIIVVAMSLHYMLQLYLLYKSDEINQSKNSYIFVLLAILGIITPRLMVSQVVIATATLGYMYLVKKFPHVNMLYTSIKIFNVFLNLFLFIQMTSHHKTEQLPFLILVCLYSVIASSLISRHNNLVSGVGIFSMYWIVVDSAYTMLYPITTNEIAIAYPIFILNTALYFSKFITLEGFNRLTQKDLFTKEETRFSFAKLSLAIPVSKVDFFSFVGIIGILSLFFEGYPSHSFFMLALYFLNFTRRGANDNALITGAIASFCLALITQEVIDIPRLYQTEYTWLILSAFMVALYYIWRESINPTTYYIYKIVLVARLFLDIIAYKEVFDSIELGVALILILLYGLYVKRLRIVVLSITSTLLLITYISFAFWNNSYWFAYLILTGVFLISLSIRIETKKRQDK